MNCNIDRPLAKRIENRPTKQLRTGQAAGNLGSWSFVQTPPRSRSVCPVLCCLAALRVLPGSSAWVPTNGGAERSGEHRFDLLVLTMISSRASNYTANETRGETVASGGWITEVDVRSGTARDDGSGRAACRPRHARSWDGGGGLKRTGR